MQVAQWSTSWGGTLELDTARFGRDFAAGVMLADARMPTWGDYRPGLGPHREVKTVALVMSELARTDPATYASFQIGAPYPNAPHQKCDLLIKPSDGPSLAIEVKMLRLLGDNGKPNDNMLMHILSPYRQHRSALTDCDKLADSGFTGSFAILIYGYEYEELPMEPAVEAFELLARQRVQLGPRRFSSFDGLVHPIHQRGGVFVWEIRH
jgi:hypothetical protein